MVQTSRGLRRALVRAATVALHARARRRQRPVRALTPTTAVDTPTAAAVVGGPLQLALRRQRRQRLQR
eukprot:2525194-Prymnesium_polylepis.1